MIEVDSLVKDYGLTRALKGVSFSIERGEVVGLLGPNGAGKSTAMRIITGFMAATSGSARIDGREVIDDPLTCQRRIGYLPEGNPLYLDMRLREALRYTASMRGIRGDEKRKAVEGAVVDAGLRGKEHSVVSSLSRGYRQRVGLAMALLHRPEILILDEPSSGLDPNQQKDMRKFIRELGGEHTVVLSTHTLPEVEAVCDRVLIISHGELVAQGTLAEIRSMMESDLQLFVTVRGDAKDVQQRFEVLPFAKDVVVTRHPSESGVVRVSIGTGLTSESEGWSAISALSETAAQAGFGLVDLRLERPSLEDVFAELTLGSPRGEALPPVPPESQTDEAPADAASESGEAH